MWARARVQRDLTRVNKFDLQSTCFLVFFRLLWAIGLSIFILSKIKSVETRDYPYQREEEKHDARAKEWELIRSVTAGLMVLEMCNVVGFVLIIMY